jgi:carbamoyl-phosphate synthase small subunit
MDLVPMVSTSASPGTRRPGRGAKGLRPADRAEFNVVAIDYGIKRNILRCSPAKAARSRWCRRRPRPKTSGAEAGRRVPVERPRRSGRDRRIRGAGDPQVIDSGTPTFGICLGHQMLGLAVGAKTMKMHQGHHGANHPVKDETTGKVEITSMNHGFAVDQATLPAGATQTHVSLFDGSNCGIALEGKPVFSVQYHPRPRPARATAHYLFKRFADLMKAYRKGNVKRRVTAG